MIFNFIVNPKSGSGRGKKDIPNLIRHFSEKHQIAYKLYFTEYAGHAEVLAKELSENEENIVVAVGGDGTVNEIANAMIHKPARMGILPIGSGNGLARHLGIQMNFSAAFETLILKNTIDIDAIKIGNKISVNVSGLGFDSQVAFAFKNSVKRGLKAYTEIALRELLHYENGNYEIIYDEKKLVTGAFLVSIANSCQFGNNVKISPTASVKDGLIDVVVIKPFPVALSLSFIPFVLSGKLNKSPFVEVYQCKKLRIIHRQKHLHIDGESIETTNNVIEAEIIPACLRVICNPKYKQ